VITRSPWRAASAAEAARAAPRAMAASRAAGTTSWAMMAKPFFTRFPTMGWPMVPVPMNAILMRVSLP
jgi:hypothetical protein